MKREVQKSRTKKKLVKEAKERKRYHTGWVSQSHMCHVEKELDKEVKK